MIFTYKGVEMPYSFEAGENVKIYKVPTNYSADELFIAKWKYGEIEPFPACYTHEATLAAEGVMLLNTESKIEFSGNIYNGDIKLWPY